MLTEKDVLNADFKLFKDDRAMYELEILVAERKLWFTVSFESKQIILFDHMLNSPGPGEHDSYTILDVEFSKKGVNSAYKMLMGKDLDFSPKKDYGFIKLHTEPYSNQGHLNQYLPQLRPMSDLIKPITHNGKTFVPAQVLWSVDIGEEEAFETYGTIPEYWKTCCESELKHHAWGDVQKLLEWHFDVFKLIPNGLAIAIK